MAERDVADAWWNEQGVPTEGLFIRDPDPAPFLTFYRDGKRARLDMVDGKLSFSGNMEIDESARMLFDELCRIAPTTMRAWFGKPKIYDADMRKEDMYVVSTEPVIGKPQA